MENFKHLLKKRKTWWFDIWCVPLSCRCLPNLFKWWSRVKTDTALWDTGFYKDVEEKPSKIFSQTARLKAYINDAWHCLVDLFFVYLRHGPWVKFAPPWGLLDLKHRIIQGNLQIFNNFPPKTLRPGVDIWQ